jgi:hypothetical protein
LPEKRAPDKQGACRSVQPSAAPADAAPATAAVVVVAGVVNQGASHGTIALAPGPDTGSVRAEELLQPAKVEEIVAGVGERTKSVAGEVGFLCDLGNSLHRRMRCFCDGLAAPSPFPAATRERSSPLALVKFIEQELLILLLFAVRSPLLRRRPRPRLRLQIVAAQMFAEPTKIAHVHGDPVFG